MRRRIVFSDNDVRLAHSLTVKSSFAGGTGTAGRSAANFSAEAAYGRPGAGGIGTTGPIWFAQLPVPALSVFLVVFEFISLYIRPAMTLSRAMETMTEVL